MTTKVWVNFPVGEGASYREEKGENWDNYDSINNIILKKKQAFAKSVENRVLKIYLHMHVHSSILHNS